MHSSLTSPICRSTRPWINIGINRAQSWTAKTRTLSWRSSSNWKREETSLIYRTTSLTIKAWHRPPITVAFLNNSNCNYLISCSSSSNLFNTWKTSTNQSLNGAKTLKVEHLFTLQLATDPSSLNSFKTRQEVQLEYYNKFTYRKRPHVTN